MKKEVEWLLKEKYHGKQTKGFKGDVRRLEVGEPLDYVIGFAEFLGCQIDLSLRPLVPRPETEFWTKAAIQNICHLQSFTNRRIAVLDIFAGSGCIGVAVLKHVKNAHMEFVDNDKKCIDQIKINCKINGINENKYHIARSDVFLAIGGKFDYILANPPYIPETRKAKIQKSVLKYEPADALFGGADGLFYINKFLKNAGKHLNKNGKIYMEFDFIQKNQIEKLFKKYHYKNWEFHKDQYGKSRWVVVDN